MPTTHTWKGAGLSNTGPNYYIYDPTQYIIATAFAPGDTLVVNTGVPTVASLSSNVVPLLTGTYQFSITGANGGWLTDNISLDVASSVNVSGPGSFQWFLFDQFVNYGAIQFGSPTTKTQATLYPSATGTPTLVNQGGITIQDGSTFELLNSLNPAALVNKEGATVSIRPGGYLLLTSILGYLPTPSASENTINNGLINVSGQAGHPGKISLGGSYQGSGLLSAAGAPGDTDQDTVVIVYGPASGTFDLSSADIQFSTTPVGGTINFLDNNAAVEIDYSALSYSLPSHPFGATINHFQPGDVVYLKNLTYTPVIQYDPGKHLLTVSATNGAALGQYIFNGNYQQNDFQIAPVGFGGAFGYEITTKSAANAVAEFSVTNNATGATISAAGQQYTGPIQFLQYQYVATGSGSTTIAAHVPNAYIAGGPGQNSLSASAGSNILNGGVGSDFLIGASGADGGIDSFYIDARQSTPAWNTIMSFHPGDSVTLWGYNVNQSVMTWVDNAGVPGDTGATIHASIGGAGTPINASVTFAGVKLADALGLFGITTGTSGNVPFLSVHWNT